MEIMKIGRAFALQWTAFSAGTAKVDRKLCQACVFIYIEVMKWE